jgi:hypothetical protein
MTLPNAKYYWKFDEGSGRTAVDGIGGAIITMDRASWQASKHGTGVKFDPSGNDGVRVAQTTLTAGAPAPWTVGVWVMREGATESASLFSSNTSAIKLEQYANTRTIGVTKFGDNDYSIPVEAPVGKWVYLTFVGTASNTTVYVDGKLQGALPVSVDLGMSWIGSTKGYAEFAAMVIDDLEIFDSALTAAQVTELYNQRSASDENPTLRWGYAYGYNVNGELMDGTNVNRNVPVKMPYFNKVPLNAIVSGSNHSVALLEDGSVWGWGHNAWAQVGDGTQTSRYAPAEVFHLRRFGVKAIAAGEWHSLALLGDGTVMAWGRNDYRQLGTGHNAPDRHTIPVEVVGLQGVKAIAAGCYHSMALLEDGTVRTWGHNGQGQLGNGTNVDSFNPAMVSNLKGVKAIAAGGRLQQCGPARRRHQHRPQYAGEGDEHRERQGYLGQPYRRYRPALLHGAAERWHRVDLGV